MIDTLFDDGRTPLMIAAQYGKIDTVRCLLDLKADIMKQRRKLTAMHFAAMYGHADVLMLLLEHTGGADVDSFASTSNNTPLMLAVRYGHTEVVKLLLDKGADARRGDGHGWTSLHRAATAGRTELVELLLEKVRDLSVKFFDENERLKGTAHARIPLLDVSLY